MNGSKPARRRPSGAVRLREVADVNDGCDCTQRLELLSTELHDGVERVALLVLWDAVELFSAFLMVVFVAVLIVVVFWDSRMLTASLLAISSLALIEGMVPRQQIAAARPFGFSLKERAKNREELTPRP